MEYVFKSPSKYVNRIAAAELCRELQISPEPKSQSQKIRFFIIWVQKCPMHPINLNANFSFSMSFVLPLALTSP